MKRIPIVLAGSVVAVLATSTVAQAATPARISGRFVTSQKATAQHNSVQPVGSVTTAPYTFRPTCASGACVTTFTRLHGDGSPETYALRPTATGAYTGASTYLGSCYSTAAQVLVANGYSYKESITLTPVKVLAGSVAAYNGTLKLTFTPTAAGRAKRCTPGFLTLALTSGKHTA